MQRLSSSADFDHRESGLLAKALVRKLVEESSLNDFMEQALPLIGDLFGAEKIVLVDYREHLKNFDVLFFEGYPPGSLYSLGRRLGEMEVGRAVENRLPFRSNKSPNFLNLPLYFSDILEAVLVLENSPTNNLSEMQLEAAKVASRFIGVLMSSTRLAVNRDQLVDHHDLQRARQIQLSFLPKNYPSSEACQVYGCNNSSAMVGGDYFDFFRLRDGSIQCILADACGHGLAAALIMSNFRGLLQSEMLRRSDFGNLFDSLNPEVHFEEEIIQYLTGVFLDFDERSRILRYQNAGHYDPIIIGKTGNHRTLPGGGPPLGMFHNSRYPQGQDEIRSGEIVTLFTDGLIDVANDNGDYFGVEGVIETVESNCDLGLSEIADLVLKKAKAFAGRREIEDDVTLFLMRVN